MLCNSNAQDIYVNMDKHKYRQYCDKLIMYGRTYYLLCISRKLVELVTLQKICKVYKYGFLKSNILMHETICRNTNTKK